LFAENAFVALKVKGERSISRDRQERSISQYNDVELRRLGALHWKRKHIFSKFCLIDEVAKTDTRYQLGLFSLVTVKALNGKRQVLTWINDAVAEAVAHV